MDASMKDIDGQAANSALGHCEEVLQWSISLDDW
jgi:hypothetical protein